MEWADEKKALLATIERQKHETAALAKRFQFLQETLQEQQKLLDRYQRALSTIQVKSRVTVSTSDKKRCQPLPKPKTCKKNKIKPTTIVNMSSSMAYTWQKKIEISAREMNTEALVPNPGLKKTDKNKKKTINIKPVVTTRKSMLASTWAKEKQRMPKKSKWKQTVALPVVGIFDKENCQMEQTIDGTTSFAYVEVVRNREERKALPGHDCIECKNYYDALEGIEAVDVAAQKQKCSRHRARFEPYQTPDDFWRLSFPDSESQ